ncbi:MAG: PEGA domain-containing protein [bacterium]|nr:PEGA domain-containing protein [bacterium]
MKKLLNLLVLISFLIFNGCATLFSGNTDDISLESEPPKAKVLLNGSNMGTTPLKVKLKREKSI